MEDNKSVSLNIAKHLTLKLIEQRTISPKQISESLKILYFCARNNFNCLENEKATLVMRFAQDITSRIIENRLISNSQDVALKLSENTKMILKALENLTPEYSQQCLTIAKDISLKLLEINHLSINELAIFFIELTKTTYIILKK